LRQEQNHNFCLSGHLVAATNNKNAFQQLTTALSFPLPEQLPFVMKICSVTGKKRMSQCVPSPSLPLSCLADSQEMEAN